MRLILLLILLLLVIGALPAGRIALAGDTTRAGWASFY